MIALTDNHIPQFKGHKEIQKYRNFISYQCFTVIIIHSDNFSREGTVFYNDLEKHRHGKTNVIMFRRFGDHETPVQYLPAYKNLFFQI